MSESMLVIEETKIRCPRPRLCLGARTISTGLTTRIMICTSISARELILGSMLNRCLEIYESGNLRIFWLVASLNSYYVIAPSRRFLSLAAQLHALSNPFSENGARSPICSPRHLVALRLKS